MTIDAGRYFAFGDEVFRANEECRIHPGGGMITGDCDPIIAFTGSGDREDLELRRQVCEALDADVTWLGDSDAEELDEEEEEL